MIIFTHYYGDPEGDSKEELQKRPSKILSNIFSTTTNTVKNVSNQNNFEDINRQYINIFSKTKMIKP